MSETQAQKDARKFQEGQNMGRKGESLDPISWLFESVPHANGRSAGEAERQMHIDAAKESRKK